MVQRFAWRWMLALAPLLLTAIVPSLVQAGAGDKRFDIYWIDTEGGAATLMVSPTGESILVDTGNPGRRDADRIFKTAAEVAGLKQIDHLVTTHYHVDHFGGAALLATFIPIKNVYDNGEFEGGRERPDKPYLEFKADKRSVLNPGDKIPLASAGADGTKLEIKCLAARQTFIEPLSGTAKNADEGCAAYRPKERDNSDNANSIVLLVSFGPFRFYDAGDLTWNMEQKLVCPVNLVGPVDVYQVTHHGLDVSNNPTVINSLTPTLAVFNNGTKKGCQPGTFAALKAAKSIQAIYQMHKNLREDTQNNAPEDFIANLEEKCTGNYLKLSVDPQGKTYTVSIPANKHEKTYETKGSR